MAQQFEVPTWNHIYTILLKMAERIRRSGFKPDTIVAISRGGWSPARVLADLLGNPNLTIAKAEFYVGIAETQKKPVLTQPVTEKIANQKILVVDEITDSGESLSLVRTHILQQGASEVKTVTIYCKPWSTTRPDYCEKETSRWVVFPWEIKETVQRILRKCAQSSSSTEPEIEKLVKAGISRRLVARFVKEVIEEEKFAQTH